MKLMRQPTQRWQLGFLLILSAIGVGVAIYKGSSEMASMIAAMASAWAAVVANVTSENALKIAKDANVTSESALKVAKDALAFEALTNLQRQYADAEMGNAIKKLWDFKRNCADILKTYPAMLGRTDGADEEEDARRRVSHYYQQFATIYAARYVPEDVIFSYWSPNDLKMVKDIIVPMEEALGIHIGHGAWKPTIDRLMTVHDAGLKFFKDKGVIKDESG